MNHYPHHIGDFDRATRHLTRIERSIYRDLIDIYYDTEQPLTLDLVKLKRKILANTEQESTAVEQVLNEFFTEIPNGWFHSRCDEEIEHYRSNNSQKAMAGKASAAAKALKKLEMVNGRSTPVVTLVQQTFNGTPTNQEPRTKNQEPINTLEGFDNFWNEYPNTHRKQSKGKCLEVWKKAKAEPDAMVIVNHVARLKASPDWTKNNGEFIPAPLVYLNNRRWEGASETRHEGGIMAGAI